MFRYITLTVCFILIVSFTCLNLFGVKKANDSSSTRYESIELVLYKNVTYQSYDGNLPNRDHIMTRNVHVPKFMLELYENNKYCNYNDTVPEVVRSVIPKSAGNLKHKTKKKEKKKNKYKETFKLAINYY